MTDLDAKKKKRVSIKKYQPKLIMLAESSSNDGPILPQPKSSHEDSSKEKVEVKNYTYEEFNELILAEKQNLLNQLITNLPSDKRPQYLSDIAEILTFLSECDKLKDKKCIKISNKFSDDIISDKISLIAKINYKSIKYLYKNNKLEKFLMLFNNFSEISILLTITIESNILKKINSIINKIHDHKSKYNIKLYIDKSTVEESEFAKNCFITDVIFSNKVKWIEKHAFFECKSLQTVKISDSVKEICVGAFQKCSSLKEIEIPNSVVNILEFGFAECSSLNNITLSSSLTVIKIGLFRNCKLLENIVIPDSVNIIENKAFENCISLKNVTLSSSLKSINTGSFKNCSSLEDIIVPDSVKIIGNYAFEDCSSLTKIQVPENVKYGIDPFLNCDNLIRKPKITKRLYNKNVKTGKEKVHHTRNSPNESSDDESDSDSF